MANSGSGTRSGLGPSEMFTQVTGHLPQASSAPDGCLLVRPTSHAFQISSWGFVPRVKIKMRTQLYLAGFWGRDFELKFKFVWSFFGKFHGKLMEKIGLKAPWNYAASFLDS